MNWLRPAIVVTLLSVLACSESPPTDPADSTEQTSLVAATCVIGCYDAATAGWYHSCVSINPGAVIHCWGNNQFGQLGTGDKINRLRPTTIKNNPGFTYVVGGEYFSCGYKGGGVGAVYCWGDNSQGQLGNGTTTSSTVPVKVSGSVSFTQVTTGRNFACGIAITSFLAYCWGNNAEGQLGTGDRINRLVPTPVVPAYTWSTISAGGGHVCAGNGAGIKCWGDNADGQLGVGNRTDLLGPGTTYILNNDWFAPVAGFRHSCAQFALGGQAVCWGDNDFGQLGDCCTGDLYIQRDQLRPTGVVLSGASGVRTGVFHTCASANSKAYCWGRGIEGQLGNAQSTNSYRSPQLVQSTAFVNRMALGYFHTIAAPSGGQKVFAWGGNSYGQLGRGNTTPSNVPVQILP